MTKKEARAMREAWRAAILDERVVRYLDGDRLVSYPTHEARDAAMDAAIEAGVPCVIAKACE